MKLGESAGSANAFLERGCVKDQPQQLRNADCVGLIPAAFCLDIAAADPAPSGTQPRSDHPTSWG